MPKEENIGARNLIRYLGMIKRISQFRLSEVSQGLIHSVGKVKAKDLDDLGYSGTQRSGYIFSVSVAKLQAQATQFSDPFAESLEGLSEPLLYSS